MAVFLGALFIFVARICDVSVGTLRVMYTIRGNRWYAAMLGLVEAAIWIIAVRQVFNRLDNYWNILGYAAGFATGTFIGITLEGWIATGWVLARVISRNASQQVRAALLERGFGVTAVRGEGREGELMILFVVARRKRGEELLRTVDQADDTSFVTIDPVSRAIGGYLPHLTPGSVRK